MEGNRQVTKGQARKPREARSPKVLEVLRKHRGTDVTIGQIMEETGFTREQVHSSVHHLITRNALPITAVVRGNVYRYEHSNAGEPKVDAEQEKPERRLFEEIGTTKNGTVVAQDQDGNLYRVVEME
jgi:hypothetical protein